MKRRLSSILVPIYKLIFIFVLFGGIYWVFNDFPNIIQPGIIILVVWCIVWYSLTFHWKSVYLKGNIISASNYWKKIEIPFSQIENVEVSSKWGMAPRRITLHLKSTSEFGDKIVFVPRFLGFMAIDSVNDLRKLLSVK